VYGSTARASVRAAPIALLRGGYFGSGTGAGPFAVNAIAPPSVESDITGFRCAQ